MDLKLPVCIKYTVFATCNTDLVLPVCIKYIIFATCLIPSKFEAVLIVRCIKRFQPSKGRIVSKAQCDGINILLSSLSLNLQIG